MLSGIFAKKEKKVISWNQLTTVSELDELDVKSLNHPVLLFKHSTRCSISSMVLSKFENAYDEESNLPIYFLDLIAHRDVSNEIETRYDVTHQSPQALLISKGKSVLDESHTGISFEAFQEKSKEIV